MNKIEKAIELLEQILVVEDDPKGWMKELLALLKKPCKVCGGKGYKMKYDYNERQGEGQKIPCPICKGTGIEPDCRTCGACKHFMYCAHERKVTYNKKGECSDFQRPDCQQLEAGEFTKESKRILSNLKEVVCRKCQELGIKCELYSWVQKIENCKTIQWIDAVRSYLDSQAARIKGLESIFDHPNHDNPKRRYLYEIRTAAMLLETFSKDECGECGGGGEYTYSIAQQLRQFIERAEQALKEK